MKVKHCFLLILIVLTSGSFFLALSVSPFFKSSLKSSNKDGSFLSLKSSEPSNDRASNVKSSVDAASPNGAPSPKSVAPLNAPSPVVIQALNPASSSESVSDLAAKLTQCRSEMESFKSSLLPKDDSKDDLRVQLQEARIKLRAAEEELQTLLAQKPRDGEVEPTSQCRVFEREANLCKTELRSTHAKYTALQGIVASFLDREHDSAASSSDSSAEKALSKDKQQALSRLVDSHDDDAPSAAHDDDAPSVALEPTEAPANNSPTTGNKKAPKSSKSGDSAKSQGKPSKISKRTPPVIDDEAALEAHDDDKGVLAQADERS